VNARERIVTPQVEGVCPPGSGWPRGRSRVKRGHFGVGW
jgi:hypothetical protein